jgi:cobalt-precorrin 5A hydrolase
MVVGEAMNERGLIAGIGCRRRVSADDIVALVRQALAETSVEAGALTTLAAPGFKANEPALGQAAAMLGVALTLVDDAAMEAAQPRCVTRSPCAERSTGLTSVAEGAALAAAGPGGELVLPRIANGAATCAIARPGDPRGIGAGS